MPQLVYRKSYNKQNRKRRNINVLISYESKHHVSSSLDDAPQNSSKSVPPCSESCITFLLIPLLVSFRIILPQLFCRKSEDELRSPFCQLSKKFILSQQLYVPHHLILRLKLAIEHIFSTTTKHNTPQ